MFHKSTAFLVTSPLVIILYNGVTTQQEESQFFSVSPSSLNNNFLTPYVYKMSNRRATVNNEMETIMA